MFIKSSAAALVTTALALSAPETPADTYFWTVTGFQSTCTAATCYYGLNVTGETGPQGQPAFVATGCSGNSLPAEFRSCETIKGLTVLGTVETKEEDLGIDTGANVFVKFTFTQYVGRQPREVKGLLMNEGVEPRIRIRGMRLLATQTRVEGFRGSQSFQIR